MNVLKAILLGVRFALEVGALVALAYWGFTEAGSTAAKALLGVGVPRRSDRPLVAFVSPNARFEHEALKLIVEVIVFGGAAAALWDADRSMLAAIYAAAAVVDTVLVYAFEA